MSMSARFMICRLVAAMVPVDPGCSHSRINLVPLFLATRCLSRCIYRVALWSHVLFWCSVFPSTSSTGMLKNMRSSRGRKLFVVPAVWTRCMSASSCAMMMSVRVCWFLCTSWFRESHMSHETVQSFLINSLVHRDGQRLLCVCVK